MKEVFRVSISFMLVPYTDLERNATRGWEGNTEQEAFAAIQRHLAVYIPFSIVTRMISQMLSLETRHNYIEFQGPVSQ